MPKLTSANPSYRKHKASAQAVVTLDGRDFYLGPHNSAASRREYDRLVGEWLQNGRRLSPARGGPTDLTIAELVLAFWKFAQGYYGGDHPGELASYKLALHHLNRLYGPTRAAEFGPLALKAVRQSMVGAGWARGYVNSQMGRLKRCFKWAVAQEMAPAAVLHALQAVDGLRAGKSDAREGEPVKPVPEAHVVAVKDHVSRQVWGMIQLQTLTGMRPGEVTSMRGRDLDTTGKVWSYKPAKHKTQHHGHERLVYLGPKAQDVVSPFLRPNTDEYLFSPADADAEARAKRTKARKTPLSCGNRPGTNRKRRRGRKPGQRYTVTSYAVAVARGCEKAFGPVPQCSDEDKADKKKAAAWKAELAAWRAAHVWSPGQLRHNAATALRKQFGAEAARVILGHRNLKVIEIYAERDVAAAQKIMNEVG